MDLSEPVNLDKEDQEILISPSHIKNVLSWNLSLTRKLTIVGTQDGFCLVDNNNRLFMRFEEKRNPFSSVPGTGVRMGSVLEERTEVAIVPSKESTRFRKNTVYIYDYQLQIILYWNDFFLPIHQMNLTDDTLVVANNKRIILYKYGMDTAVKNQEYYLKMYVNKEPNDRIRYIKMDCHERLNNNSVAGFDEENGVMKGCHCGKYSISWAKPYKIIFSKVFFVNAKKYIELAIYDNAIDKAEPFSSFDYNEVFSFAISEDGKNLAYSEDEGRFSNIYRIENKELLIKVRISGSIKECLDQNILTYEGSIWYIVIRKDKQTGNLHLLKMNSEKKEFEQFTRYFDLGVQVIEDYGISQKFINPYYHQHNGNVFATTIWGGVYEIYDFKRKHNGDKSYQTRNYLKWNEESF